MHRGDPGKAYTISFTAESKHCVSTVLCRVKREEKDDHTDTFTSKIKVSQRIVFFGATSKPANEKQAYEVAHQESDTSPAEWHHALIHEWFFSLTGRSFSTDSTGHRVISNQAVKQEATNDAAREHSVQVGNPNRVPSY
jgi:hypothetical protein